MKTLMLPKKIQLLAIFFLAFGALMFGGKSVYAYIPPDPGGNGVSSDSPPGGSGTFYSGNASSYQNAMSKPSIQPFYDIGNNAGQYTYADNQTRLYVNKSSGGVNVTIVNGGADCHNYTSGALVGPDYTESGGTPIVQYNLIGAGGTILDTHTSLPGDGCAQYSLSASAASAYSITPTANYDGYLIVEAQMTNAGGQGENSYTISVTTNGVVGSGSSVFGLGYRAQDINLGNYWASWTNFALPISCNDINNPFSAPGETVNFYDTDVAMNGTNGTENWNTDQIYALEEQTIDANNNTGSWTTLQTKSQSAGEIPQNGSFTFTARSDARYRIILANVGVRNTIRLSISTDFSTLYSKLSERPNASRCTPVSDGANCPDETLPTLDYTQAGTSQAISIVATNTGTTTWNNTYYLKRISGSVIVGHVTGTVVKPNSYTFIDHVNAPAPGNQLTLQYQMYNGNNNSFGGVCTIILKTGPKPTPGVTSCAASMSSPTGYANNTIPSGTAPHIHVNVTNGTTTTYLANVYTVRQVTPTGANSTFNPSGGLRYLTRNLTKDQTDTRIPDFLINARTTTTQITLNFWYNLFPDDVSGTPPVAPGTRANPLCHVSITWKAGATGCTSNCGGASSATIAAACGQTSIGGVFVPATYHPQSATYYTNKPGPYATPPPNFGPNPTPTAPYPYTPPPGPATLITIVPAKVHVTDNQDGRSWDYYIDAGNNGGVKNGTSLGNGAGWQGNTFDMGSGNQMWPHHTYHFELFLEGTAPPTDSTTYQNSGSWGYYGSDPNPIATADSPSDCLRASCLGGSSPDLEPGQNADLSGGIHFDNQTSAGGLPTDSTDAYSIHVDITGGYGASPGDPIGTDNTIGAFGGTDVKFSFNTTISYQVTYSWTLQFQGNNLDIGQGIPCNVPPITPATRPFFQVLGADVNTGGGFEKQDPTTGAYTCPSNYPDYVSPSAPGLPGGPAYNYGGIKAYGAADSTYGSQSDFGAIALGIIAKNPNSNTNGPPYINFHAQPSFSNTSTPWGQLNSTSPNYCVIDFFDKTQQSPNLIGAPGDISGVDNNQQDIVNGPISGFGGGVVNPNENKVLYVNGDVTITGDIKYQPWNVDNQKPPSFVLIVRGNINVASSVKQLDGLYIAQPTSGGVDGEFNTCASNGGNQFCNQQLVVNGAVIARRIKPLRSVGTVSPDANPNFSPAPGHNAAEIFNFTPSMVLSNPNFTPIYSDLQGIFSLPPVF